MKNHKPDRILTINATEGEVLAWTVTAAEMGLSRSAYTRQAVEKSRDMDRIIAEQKISKPRKKWTQADRHAIGSAAIDLWDHNHPDC